MSLEHSPSRQRKISRWPAVKERFGKSRTQIWRDIRAGKFPAPVQLGPNSIGWYDDELDAHAATLNRVAYAPATRQRNGVAT